MLAAVANDAEHAESAPLGLEPLEDSAPASFASEASSCLADNESGLTDDIDEMAVMLDG